MSVEPSEHFDVREVFVVTRRVELRVAARLPSISAATNAAIADLKSRGIDADDHDIYWSANGSGGGVVSYDVNESETLPAAAPEEIVAYLPRDWPRQVEAITSNHGYDNPHKVRRLKELIDQWVFLATSE